MREASTVTDSAFCEAILPKVSRTFALSISLLSPKLQGSVGLSYLLCRILDSIEDDPKLSFKEQTALFDGFDAVLANDSLAAEPFEQQCVRKNVGETARERDLCARATAPIRLFRSLRDEERAAIRPHIQEMSSGMREYSERAANSGALRIRDLQDLERYCYFVAGTVGNLLTDLFELQVQNLSESQARSVRNHAAQFGLGLQLVNILKDVAEDAQRNVCFLPQDALNAEGVQNSELLSPQNREAVLKIIRQICSRATAHLRAAETYCMTWPATSGAEVRLFCAVPLSLALSTLREVMSGNDTLRAGTTPKVSREEVYRTVNDARKAVGSDPALRSMLARYREPAEVHAAQII